MRFLKYFFYYLIPLMALIFIINITNNGGLYSILFLLPLVIHILFFVRKNAVKNELSLWLSVGVFFLILVGYIYWIIRFSGISTETIGYVMGFAVVGMIGYLVVFAIINWVFINSWKKRAARDVSIPVSKNY